MTSLKLKLFLPLTFLSIALFSGELKANANEKPVTSKGAALLGQPSIDVNQLATPLQAAPLTVAQTSPATPSETVPGRAVPGSTPSGTETNPANVTPSNTTPSIQQTTPSTIPATPTTPDSTTPGTVTPSTIPITPSTTPTTPDSTTPTTPDSTTPTTPDSTTPITPTTIPTQELAPGRATQSGSSYIGVGGNIGIGDGDIPLGQGSFSVISKIGLTRNFSVRPSVMFNDDVAILIPVTYDFSFGEGPTDGLGFTAAPYLGVGAAISTGDDGEVGLLLTGGIDVPLSSQFTATAAVNASVTGQAAVGIMLGVGYNFAGF
ncbi:MAG: hypothetical protein MUC48_11585 [Leptolyngbya sp. Prado105]|jgi:hypothetical protein|nr:hypothetical protein [Leptolyngbya sp. Prado105]